MKQGSTLFLKSVVVLMGVAVAAFCVIVLPEAMKQEGAVDYRPIAIGMYISAVPFFFALYQTLNLLSYIDENKSFSQRSVQALKYIKYSAASIGLLYTAGMPLFVQAAHQDDAPGVVVLGIIFIFGGIVTATFAAVLQKLVQNGVDLKSENDLTV